MRGPTRARLSDRDPVSSRLAKLSEGRLRYFWKVELLPGSRRPLRSLVFADFAGVLAGPKGWVSFPVPEGVLRRPTAGSVSASDEGVDDLRPGETATFSLPSSNLPSLTILSLLPRRPYPCIPTTPEEEQALEKKGWTAEEARRLNLADFWTNREIVLAPMLPADGSPRQLFALALKRLADLQDYLAFVPDPEPPRPIPDPPQTAEYADMTLRQLRDRALVQKNYRPQDRPLVDSLFQFYSTLPGGKP